jgi:serine/threonine protein kinase
MTAQDQNSIEKEILAMRTVEHPNVLQLKNVLWNIEYPRKKGTMAPRSMLVLDYAPNGEMLDYLTSSGHFPEEIARTYFQQMCSALAACHAVGVTHRDLKPENILFDAKFNLKLCDFGLASLNGGSGNKTYCGTPSYMAPEIYNLKSSSAARYDATAADVWSAAVVLFIMMAGFPPFAKPDMSDWWFDKLSRGKNSLFWKAHCRTATFSESAKDLINKMLSVDAGQRITLAGITAHPFFNGHTLTPQGLVAELTDRKAAMDMQKDREALEKKARQGQAGFGSDGDVVLRGEAIAIAPDNDDELPPYAPSIDVFVPDQAPGDNQIDAKELNVTEEPPEFKEGDGPVCYTQFDSTIEPIDLLTDLMADLNSPLSPLTNITRKGYKIKGTTLGEKMSIVVQIYKKGEGSTVRFRRIYGEMYEFKSFYMNTRDRVLAE